MAFRVPVLNVSVVDLVVRLSKDTSLDKIRELVKKCKVPNVIGYTDEELVSSDLNGDSRSSILDLNASMEINPRSSS